MIMLEKLLENVVAATQSSTSVHTEDDKFNILKVLGVQTKEVIICRLIGELLDPNGTHKMGAQPLENFFRWVLRETVPADLSNTRIELEEKIDGDRRVDIAIHIGSHIYPIEVKVWAGDQDAQLSDYYKYYKAHNEIDKIYYLTPYGWKPSKESTKSLSGEKVQCCSFQNEVCAWLDAIDLDYASNNVKIAIKQFREVVADMVAENYTVEQIKNLLNLDSESAFKIDETLRAAVSLLNAKDVLVERIIINYLQSVLQLPVGYSLEEDTSKTVDKHSLLRITKDDVAIAWICVETNLYIVARKVKHNHLWKEINENYVWQYLHPNGTGKKFPLRDLECIFKHHDSKIDLKNLLFDINIAEA